MACVGRLATGNAHAQCQDCGRVPTHTSLLGQERRACYYPLPAHLDSRWSLTDH